MPSWLVARTLPNRERLVQKRLVLAGTSSYYPIFSHSVIDRRTHRPRVTIEPLFPCYLFVHSPYRFYFIRETEDVTSVVMDGETAARSRGLDRAVEKMIRIENRDGMIEMPVKRSKFATGDRLRIMAGVFQDLLGTCVGTADEQFGVLLDMLGRKVRVDYNERDLAAA
jgi:transcription antitermination factor NusG